MISFNNRRFPDPKRLVRDLYKDGFKTIVIVDPGVKVDPGYHMYDQGMQGDYFLKDAKKPDKYYVANVWPGRCHFPDFTKPEVQKWWGDAHKFYTDKGVAGIWNDMNELAGWGPDIPIPNVIRIPVGPPPDWDALTYDRGRDTHFYEIKNAYALLENQATYEGLLGLRPDKRPYIISRSGYSGYQRYAGMWTGDNTASWGHLAITTPMLQNIGTSGVPVCGADIGGFMLNPSPELYARWIQQGVFYTFARTHTAIFMPNQEPWSYGEEVEEIAREYIRLRYKLLPYTYSVTEEASRTGIPIMRSTYLEFPDDENVLDREEVFMHGPSLMVVPVVKKGAREVDVYLPEGAWYDLHTKRFVGEGPKTLSSYPAPLNTMPIFARSGAIIPTAPVVNYVGEKPWAPLVVEIFPGNGSFTLYEDAGDGYGYRHGAYARTKFEVENQDDAISLYVDARDGTFMVPQRTMRMLFYDIDRPSAVLATGGWTAGDVTRNPIKLNWSYDEEARTIKVEYPDKGRETKLTILRETR